MKYSDIWKNARQIMYSGCSVCQKCNGVACKGKVPGIGSKGNGRGFTKCVEFLESVKINIDTIYDYTSVDAGCEFFGQKMKYPIFAAPIGGMAPSYDEAITEKEYVERVVFGMNDAGCMAFTGDGEEIEYMAPLEVIKEAGGRAVPTMKPWGDKKAFERIDLAKKAGACAIANDIDSVAIPLYRVEESYAPPRGVNALKKLVDYAEIPFILKGIMTAEGAQKAVQTGAYGIVVSNHGGRFIEDTPATAEVLPEIRKAVGDKIKIFVDGGIRTGEDIFKCIALGANAVLIGRPFSQAAIGGGREGVKMHAEKLGRELEQVMMMTGCATLSDISVKNIRLKNK